MHIGYKKIRSSDPENDTEFNENNPNHKAFDIRCFAGDTKLFMGLMAIIRQNIAQETG